jgi:hypothetical protein
VRSRERRGGDGRPRDVWPRATAVAITVEEAAEVDTVAEAIPLDIVHEDAT